MKQIRFCPECGSELTDEMHHEDRVRQVCSSDQCQFVFWNNPTPVVAAIILLGDEVMLVNHVGWPPKMLGLVSGFLEAREHPDDAMRREIKEETGLDVLNMRLIGHYAFQEQNQLIIAYEAECEGDIQLNEELVRYKLLDPEKLVPWAIGTGPAVKDWLAQRTVQSDQKD